MNKPGFTLAEIVVSLFIMSISLVLLLGSINRGIGRLEEAWLAFDSTLAGETAVNARHFELEPPGTIQWEAQNISSLPDFPVFRLVPGHAPGGPRRRALRDPEE